MEKFPVTNLEQRESTQPSLMEKLRASFAVKAGAVIAGLSASQSIAIEPQDILRGLDAESFQTRESTQKQAIQMIRREMRESGTLPWKSDISFSPEQAKDMSPEVLRRLRHIHYAIAEEEVRGSWKASEITGDGQVQSTEEWVSLLVEKGTALDTVFQIEDSWFEMPPFIQRVPLYDQVQLRGTRTFWQTYQEIMKNEPDITLGQDGYGRITLINSAIAVRSRTSSGPLYGELTLAGVAEGSTSPTALNLSMASEGSFFIHNIQHHDARALSKTGEQESLIMSAYGSNGTSPYFDLPRFPADAIEMKCSVRFSENEIWHIDNLDTSQRREGDRMTVLYNSIEEQSSGIHTIELSVIAQDGKDLARRIRCIAIDRNGHASVCKTYCSLIDGVMTFTAFTKPEKLIVTFPKDFPATREETLRFENIQWEPLFGQK